jgi:hypothetical protein
VHSEIWWRVYFSFDLADERAESTDTFTLGCNRVERRIARCVQPYNALAEKHSFGHGLLAVRIELNFHD